MGGAGKERMAHWANAVFPAGFRALAADGLWLKVYSAWAVRDIVRTEGFIRLATLADSRPVGFWLNGARIMAYDVPEWKIAFAGPGGLPKEVQKRIVEEQACAGLRFLEAASKLHGENAAFWVEMGNIHVYRRGDLSRGAECFRCAAESPDAPYYAARIYAELLCRSGKLKEAYAWLRGVHPCLPVADETAMSGVVLVRIRELERRLNVPPGERYVPPFDLPVQRKLQRNVD
jgi:hypothetical protein